MSKPTKTIPPNLQAWIQARRRHRLSHAQVQMARELGMNPTKLGSIDNHRHEPGKAPLPEFIESLYFKRFGREQPEVVVSIEERARQLQQQKANAKQPRPNGAPIRRSQATSRDQLNGARTPAIGMKHGATGFAIQQKRRNGRSSPVQDQVPDLRQAV